MSGLCTRAELTRNDGCIVDVSSRCSNGKASRKQVVS